MLSLRMSRSASLMAATSLSLSLVWGDVAVAQQAPGAPPPPAGEAAPSANPPPARVGRLSALDGTVSFHQAGTSDWQTAAVNTPVTTGDAVFAQSGGHAELEIASSLVALDGASELDVATLDDTNFTASEPQGRIFVALGQQPQGATTQIATPRGTVTLAGPGEYEISAGDSTTPTLVTVLQGSAQVTATTLSLNVGAGQTADITGTDQIAGNVVQSGAPDGFASRMVAELARQNTSQLPPLVAGMTGCQALAGVGSWHQNPQYGQVWYPPVSSGWVPYREGHWAYVQPWGWTWVDNESWGFAPFHYGRWAYVDDRWGWIPGDPAYSEGYEGPEYGGYPEPVYSPALVSWGDVAAGAVAGAVVGGVIGSLIGGRSGPDVGWVPLGPGEPYIPPYGYNRGYFNRINVLNVRNVTRITNINDYYAGRNFGGFANRRAATLVPAAAIIHGENVRAHAHDFTRAAFDAHPVFGRHVLGAPPEGVRGHAASGPALNPAFFHPQHLEGGRLPFRGGAPAGFHGGPGGGPGGAPGGAPGGMGPGPHGGPGFAGPGPHGPNGAMGPGPHGPGFAGGGLPQLRPHDEVAGGRPGAVPEIGRPGEPGHPGEPQGGGHAGLIAGAAAGAVGAGLAAHALANRGPGARPGFPGGEHPGEHPGFPGGAHPGFAPGAHPGGPEHPAFAGGAHPGVPGGARPGVGGEAHPGAPVHPGFAGGAPHQEPGRAPGFAGARPGPRIETPHFAQRPASPQFHAPAPRPEFHAAPRPQFHAPAPRPEFHAPAPRPAFHPAPAPRPAFHPAPAPRPAPRPPHR